MENQTLVFQYRLSFTETTSSVLSDVEGLVAVRTKYLHRYSSMLERKLMQDL